MCEVGIVAVVRADSEDQAKRIADACLEGGIPATEMTFTVPKAHKIIEALCDEYKNGVVAEGAGGCLTAGAKTGDYAPITKAAKEFVAKIKEARGK